MPVSGAPGYVPSVVSANNTPERDPNFPSRGLIVGTTGAYALHLPRGATPLTITLTAGVVYDIPILGVKLTAPAPAGTVWYLD